MPIAQGLSAYVDQNEVSSSYTGSASAVQKKPRRSPSRCNTPVRESSQNAETSSRNRWSPRRRDSPPNESRQELIERKKREQRAWLREGLVQSPSSGSASEAPSNDFTGGPPLLPPVEFGEGSSKGSLRYAQENLQVGSGIERPRSALHRGDFRQDSQDQGSTGLQPGSPYPRPGSNRAAWAETSPTRGWFQPRFPGVPQLQTHETFAGFKSHDERVRPIRQRASSYSARTLSFALQAPTSPLVNESRNNSDSDSEGRSGRLQLGDKSSRRRTFSPGALQSIRPSATSHDSSPTVPRALPNVRRDASFPYQAHQPRRSITDTFPYSIPHTPSAHCRRPSLASESSPLQRAPMVGRYEESILRGRMSSLPSRPLDFVAQIGVLGKGNCKTSLRCPPHVSVPFPAVFYNYGSRPGSPNKSEAGPSPYVGQIDLSALSNSQHRAKESGSKHHESMDLQDCQTSEPINAINVRKRQRSSKHTRSSSSLAPNGYRIPQKGQLQIIIKNPNKTAVKLFLIPYDLEGMVPGQKTFIRQRSYSAGPIIEMPLSSRRNYGTDRPEAALSNSDDPKERPVLRYLIHVNICCPAKGRFFLYRSVRVVFANRVPDGKEKLRQEIQLPEPRYSTWKPELERDQSRSNDANLRATTQFDYDATQRLPPFGGPALDQLDGLGAGLEHASDLRAFTFPFQQTAPVLRPVRTGSKGHGGAAPPRTPPSPMSTDGGHECRACARVSPQQDSPTQHKFQRLTREAYTGESPHGRPLSPRPGEGLLALQLRDISDSRPNSRG